VIAVVRLLRKTAQIELTTACPLSPPVTSVFLRETQFGERAGERGRHVWGYINRRHGAPAPLLVDPSQARVAR
jgi:hypothetical protein